MGRRLRAIVLGLAFLPAQAMAWGPTGHRIAADIAQRQLHGQARDEVTRLLGVSAARRLADVATWADEVRDDPAQRELSRATARLHYVNFADSRCHFDRVRICPNGQCVVAGINHYADVLGDRSRDDRERAQALKFLVHLVADAHQPLHAGYRTDRGGNNHQVRFQGRGNNLHAIWDSKLIGGRHPAWRDRAAQLAAQPIADSNGNPVDWVEQSCRITRDDGVYPAGRTIDQAYLARMRPVAETQLRRAGKRLADLLNRLLD